MRCKLTFTLTNSQPMPEELCFDLFRGELLQGAIRIETVRGLAEAKTKMEEIAAQQPDKYFLYSSESSSVVVSINSSPGTSAKARGAGKLRAASK